MRNNPPLIAHIILRLHIGGLENGLVNLINHMPRDRYRHAVICLKEHTDFRDRIQDRNVPVFALNKLDGKDPGMYVRLWRLLRQLRPDIVHTRNLAAMDSVLSAVAAGVPCRIHSEHGWDVYDLHGKNWKYNLIRRACRPFIHRYIALSRDIEQWLRTTVRVSPQKLSQVYNGVDTKLFHPRDKVKAGSFVSDNFGSNNIVIGTVGRLARVKDQLTLVRAFTDLVEANPVFRDRVRLAIIGDGPMKQEVRSLLRNAGLLDLTWMPGPRNDVYEVLRSFDIFVLPSMNEGISNTILEAMATGLPVIATDVGGNPELVERGRTGLLVPPSDPEAMAKAMKEYLDDPEMMRSHGRAARERVEEAFSLETMVGQYLSIYDSMLGTGE